MAHDTRLQILWLPFLLLLPLLLLLLKKLINKPQKHFPPSPPKLPIIANLHQFSLSGLSPHQNLWPPITKIRTTHALTPWSHADPRNLIS
ncbi:hypothetical protein M0R45_021688 [Rubus argutus]|uniref:Cytochrome P450 n=1 Tax=Rubus argutus TaxID=59490 RepID=A0AAW1XDP9_RUBAR